jgi:threonine dehydrogenase-like Zn-dependent dehydrogenase
MLRKKTVKARRILPGRSANPPDAPPAAAVVNTRAPSNPGRLAMKALVYHGPGRKSWDDVADPRIVDDTDAIIGVDATTICGTDLHILKGDLPETAEGRILGHEAVGTVEAVGSAVTTIKPGDRVVLSCVSACGRCRYCREARYGQCLGGGGWILGYKIDGTQADFVRVPFVDTSTYLIPAGLDDEAVLMLADILPTAYEVGVVNGGIRPGDTVAIVGAGPIGLSAILGARLYSPSHIIAIDLADSRLEAAKHFGADVTVNPSRQDPAQVGCCAPGSWLRRSSSPTGSRSMRSSTPTTCSAAPPTPVRSKSCCTSSRIGTWAHVGTTH